jgi:26S proteasome regulatory subunit N8
MSTTSASALTDAIIHPLVLLSVADHYNRKNASQNRVVGVLLGNRNRGRVDISNSFAVPFEEDLNNLSVWFLDHNFLDTMYWMFKKVNCKHMIILFIKQSTDILILTMKSVFSANEEIVGFYSSGPKVKENDLKVMKCLIIL